MQTQHVLSFLSAAAASSSPSCSMSLELPSVIRIFNGVLYCHLKNTNQTQIIVYFSSELVNFYFKSMTKRQLLLSEFWKHLIRHLASRCRKIQFRLQNFSISALNIPNCAFN